MSSNFDFKTKTTYVRESANMIAKRSSAADNHMKEGKSYKHAWYLAFQEFPREETDEDPQAKGNLRTKQDVDP
jgi:hypothetical protein